MIFFGMLYHELEHSWPDYEAVVRRYESVVEAIIFLVQLMMLKEVIVEERNELEGLFK